MLWMQELSAELARQMAMAEGLRVEAESLRVEARAAMEEARLLPPVREELDMQREEARNLANQLAAAEDRANQLMAEAEGRANQLMAAAAESEREKGRATAAEEAEVSRGARRSRFWDFPAFSVFCEDGFNARCVALRGLV